MNGGLFPDKHRTNTYIILAFYCFKDECTLHNEQHLMPIYVVMSPTTSPQLMHLSHAETQIWVMLNGI